jgi:hypothetical protein
MDQLVRLNRVHNLTQGTRHHRTRNAFALQAMSHEQFNIVVMSGGY